MEKKSASTKPNQQAKAPNSKTNTSTTSQTKSQANSKSQTAKQNNTNPQKADSNKLNPADILTCRVFLLSYFRVFILES